jgi:hypothetical protein
MRITKLEAWSEYELYEIEGGFDNLLTYNELRLLQDREAEWALINEICDEMNQHWIY